MNTLKQFLAKYSITSHSVAALIIFFVGAFYAVPSFHDGVMQVYGMFPAWLKSVVVIAIALIGYYRNPQQSAAAQPKASSTCAGQGMKIVALLLIPALLLGMVGCSVNVSALMDAVISSTQAILNVAAPNDPFAAQLKSALTAFQTAKQQWQAGGTIAKVDDAMNTLMAVLAAIPATAQYSALIDVAVAGIEDVLPYLPLSTQKVVMAKLQSNPRLGKVSLKRSVRHWTLQGAYKAEWNKTAKRIGLPQATI
jgi:hypothetical protein